MKNIDFLTIEAFINENIDFFIGARVQKIQQPTRRNFMFSLRNNGESRKLYININPELYHITFASEENLNRRGITIPKQPPMFCMLLRKYLEGVKISDVLAVKGERIIEFHFDIIDELSQKRSVCLAVELMGKHSNLILYDRENFTIIGCAHNVGPEKSRYRELQGGFKYTYPPKGVNDLSLVTTPNFKTSEIDNYFASVQEERNLKIEKEKLLKTVNSDLKKINSSAEKISLLLKKRDKCEKYKLYGELLTANLYQKKDYSKEIEVFDYVNNKNIVIELDETKTLNENAQKYYKLYNKAKNTRDNASKMLEELSIKKEYCENLLYSINSAEKIENLIEIKDELGLNKEVTKKKGKPDIEKRDISGFEVYIGKNNKQNDYIVSKLAKDEDYWFHTRLCAGSHILLKVKAKEPDEKTIFECCKLAREFSSAKQPSKVGVIYTKRKYLKKPPSAPLGYVTYKNEKEILI